MRRLLFAAALLAALPGAAKKKSIDTTELEMAMDDAVAEADRDEFTLYFLDAVTGAPIAGAQASFGGHTTTTDNQGRARFTLPEDIGADSVEAYGNFSRQGYVKARFQVRFVAGTVFQNRYSVSPALPPGRLRIVLDWGSKPADLDAHLVKQGGWHISFQNMRRFEDRAWLDRDSMRGYGPETISLERPDASATYSFYVHDFTNQTKRYSGALADSRAQVHIYSEAGLVRSFAVPAGFRGTKWEVFKTVDGQVVP